MCDKNLTPSPAGGWQPNECPAILSIITSIAREEDALACILNAECAKMNRILETYGDIENLLAINQSVQSTIEQVTRLEGVLQAKLDALIPLVTDCMR